MKRSITRIILAFTGLVMLWISGCREQECRYNPATRRVECREPEPRNASDCDPTQPFDKRCLR